MADFHSLAYSIKEVKFEVSLCQSSSCGKPLGISEIGRSYFENFDRYK